jgi:hypothetical protein
LLERALASTSLATRFPCIRQIFITCFLSFRIAGIPL